VSTARRIEKRLALSSNERKLTTPCKDHETPAPASSRGFRFWHLETASISFSLGWKQQAARPSAFSPPVAGLFESVAATYPVCMTCGVIDHEASDSHTLALEPFKACRIGTLRDESC
jgi:hypothetical protein